MDKEIVKACVKCGNKLFTGFDHGECFEEIERNDAENAEQGFIDNEGNFVDRKEAMIIAEKAGQLKYKLGKKTLISEDLHLNWLNKQADKIADLEAKLAESKRKYEDRKKFCIIETRSLTEIINNLLEENNQLKRQLVEKDKYTYTGKEVGDIERNYEHQLAEKDQAIEGLQEINQSLGQTCNNDAKEIERLREKESLLNLIIDGYYTPTNIVKRQIREQNQTAIAELEKVKEWANNMYDGWKSNDGVNLDAKSGICNTLQAVCGMVNQQIKSLKGEK